MLIPIRTTKRPGQAISVQAILGKADTANLVILPFKASVLATGLRLSFTEALAMRHRKQAQHLHIERSYPGAPEAIGWTIFQHTARAYLYEGEPLFLHEKGARRQIRKVYAIRQDLSDDILTTSDLHI